MRMINIRFKVWRGNKEVVTQAEHIGWLNVHDPGRGHERHCIEYKYGVLHLGNTKDVVS